MMKINGLWLEQRAVTLVIACAISLTFSMPTPVGQNAQTPPVISGGLVISTGPNEFVFAGTGVTVTFEADTPGDPIVGILSAQEGKYTDGQWIEGRWLNGDQTHQGRHLRLVPGKFGIQRIRLYRYR
ncbi:MAG: DUF5597 domain-containing protein [Blastocatellia bacterium]